MWTGFIAEGTESGGHVGEMTTMALVPQVVDAVSAPVIAAGGHRRRPPDGSRPTPWAPAGVQVGTCLLGQRGVPHPSQL